MKNILLPVLITILLVGCDSLNIHEFVSISNIVKQGKKKQKASLVYFYTPDCMTCELFDLKVLKDKEVIHYINDHFIFYKVDISRNKEFNKILYTYGAPLLCILNGDEFKNLFSAPMNADLFLFSLENYKSVPFSACLAGITKLKGDSEAMAKAMNGLMKLKSGIESGLMAVDSVRLCLENDVGTFPYFYNQYLLADYYEKADSVKIMNIYKELIEHLTGLEELIYGDELKELYHRYYKIEPGQKGNIRFEHLTYDFGEVNMGEKVTHDFPFLNAGRCPLLIYSVNSTCGCTTPYWTRNPILSGVTDSIRVELLVNTPGKVQKSVYVITNSEKKITTLTITANIK